MGGGLFFRGDEKRLQGRTKFECMEVRGGQNLSAWKSGEGQNFSALKISHLCYRIWKIFKNFACEALLSRFFYCIVCIFPLTFTITFTTQVIQSYIP